MWSRKNFLQPTDTVVGCWAHSTLLAWISTGVLSRLHGRWLMSPPVLFALRLAVPISNHWWEFCHSSRRPSSSAGQFDPWPLARYCPASARDGRRRAESIFDAVSAIAIVRGCLSVWLASRPAWQLRVRRPGHITRLRRPATRGVVQLMCHGVQNSAKKKHRDSKTFRWTAAEVVHPGKCLTVSMWITRMNEKHFLALISSALGDIVNARLSSYCDVHLTGNMGTSRVQGSACEIKL